MALKGVLATLDGLDEATQKLYKKRDDGKFQLDVEGLVESDKLDEFRSNNVELKKKIETLSQTIEQYKGIDPKKAKEALDQLHALQEKKLIDEGKIEELLTQRTERMKLEFAEQLAAKDKMIGDLNGKVESSAKEKDRYIITNELSKAVDASELGFQSGVSALLEPQVLSQFAIRDGKVVAVKPDGSLQFGKEGNPKTLTEFLGEVAKERPFLVRDSKGGGAVNQTRGNNTGITLSDEQLRDPRAYRNAKAEAEKRGVPLQTT